jgi:hypothetical protein
MLKEKNPAYERVQVFAGTLAGKGFQGDKMNL